MNDVNEMLRRLSAKGFDTAKVTHVIANKSDGFGIWQTPVRINSRYKTKAGMARWKSCGDPIEIIMAERLFQNGWNHVFSTFVHELAHLLNPFDGHGHRWRRDCIAMGGDGCRTHSLPFMRRERRPMKVVGYCEKCGDEIMGKSYPRKGYTYTHLRCGGRVVAIRKRGGVKVLDKQRNEQIEAFLRDKAVDDPRVEAVRNDSMVGTGTGSMVDELVQDWEIVQELDKEGITKPTFARMHYRKMQRIHQSIVDHPR